MMTLNGFKDSDLPEDFPLNLNDPKVNVDNFVRLMGSTNPTVETYGYFGGHIFASLDNEKMTPLLGIEGIGVSRFELQKDGSYKAFHREIGFYSDVKTGKYIDMWDNPLTGDKVEIYHIKNKQVNAELAPVNRMDFDGHMVEVPFPGKWDIMGDIAVNNFELHMAHPTIFKKEEWPREYPGPTTKISEMFLRQFKTADLLNQKLDSIPAQGSWFRVGTWFPWMLMGEAKGEVAFRTHALKLGGIDDIPKRLLKKIEATDAEHLQAPPASSWGTPNESSINNFIRARKPAPVK